MSNNKPVQNASPAEQTTATAPPNTIATDGNSSSVDSTTTRSETPEPRHPYLTGATANAEWNAKKPDEQKVITDAHSLWWKAMNKEETGIAEDGDSETVVNTFKVWSATAGDVDYRADVWCTKKQIMKGNEAHKMRQYKSLWLRFCHAFKLWLPTISISRDTRATDEQLPV